MKTGKAFLLFAAAALPFAAYAGSNLSKLSKMKNPGEWETTVTVMTDMAGMPEAMKKPQTKTVKKCLTQKELDSMSDFTPKSVNEMTCTLAKKNLTGNTFTYTMKCSGKNGELTMIGSTVFDSKDASHSHVNMKGKLYNMPMTMTMDAKSKRLGPCTPESESNNGG